MSDGPQVKIIPKYQTGIHWKVQWVQTDRASKTVKSFAQSNRGWN